MFSVLDIVALAAIAAFAWLAWDSLRAREVALTACRAACRAEGRQLLDETVAIRSVRPVRDDRGVVCLRRVYVFEYSDTGHDRLRGTVTLDGARVLVLQLANGRDRVAPMRLE